MKLKQLGWVFPLIFSNWIGLATTARAQNSEILGAWTHPTKPFPLVTPDTFDFTWHRAGDFSRHGGVKWMNAKPGGSHWWITHRLSAGESLTPSAGTNLAHHINSKAPESLLAIELDLEPLSTQNSAQAGSIVAFFTAVREKLRPTIRLHVTLPPVAPAGSGAPHRIDAKIAQRILAAVDGVDLMLYDTGSANEKDYHSHLSDSIHWLLQMMPEAPTKRFVIGIPSYPDATPLHQKGVETVTSFLSFWARLSPEQRKGLCVAELSFAVYSGWTMSAADKLLLGALKEEWQKCRTK